MAYGRLIGALKDLGIPVDTVCGAGIRRLDVAADLWTGSPVEGLGLLECVAAASIGSNKLATYRAERCLESVLIKTPAGRTLARLYDRGASSEVASRGRWIRLEAQWRFPRGSRPDPGGLDGDTLRQHFKRRFELLWQPSGGFRLGGLETVSERVAEAIDNGQLQPSRARSVVGYLVLRSAGIAQGASRTVYELERECRQLGLSISLLETSERRIDMASVLDECFAPELWR